MDNQEAQVVPTLIDGGEGLTISWERKDGARFILAEGYPKAKAASLEAIAEAINAGLVTPNLNNWAEETPRYGSARHAQAGDVHLYDSEEFGRHFGR
ncbi:MAG: hypothetical protein C9356_11765 [Oleiphilus sp.]|nr:MAG: hypothetical protein C9356_11765 [Oleiphilus sp.]